MRATQASAMVVATLLAVGVAAAQMPGPMRGKPAPAPAPNAAAAPTPGARLLAAAGTATALLPGRGELLGLVTDAGGRPEAGAVILVRGQGVRTSSLRQLTTAEGLFRLTGLEPGIYYVEVGKGARVAERQRVVVHASERALLLVNLPQLLRSVQFGPPPGTNNDQAFDWALRQATVWRPILRLDDSARQDAADEDDAPESVQGYVALTAGGGVSALDVPMLETAFGVDSGMWGGGRVAFTGMVGSNGIGDGGDTRVAATFQPADDSDPNRLMVAMREVSIPGEPELPPLRLFSLNYASGMNLGDNLRLQFGTMLNSATLTDTVATVDPYLRAVYRVGQQGQLEYRIASAVPPLQFLQNYAQMPDPTPQVTLDDNRARLEHAHHQEVRYTESLTANDSISAAVFDDHFSGTAINGAFALSGSLPADTTAASLDGNGNLLPDLLNNMFIANGGDYGGWGYRFVFEHKLGQTWRADLGYANGAVLVPNDQAWTNALAESLATGQAHAFTFKLSGTTPWSHTQMVCSYRALDRLTATGLDLYDDSGDQSDSYANLYLRQPLPGFFGGGSGKVAALVEIHNLLAQGYIPMLGSDGHTLYLVQSARSLRGGLTFSF